MSTANNGTAVQPVIEVSDVVHSFKGRRALDHVSFKVMPQSLHGFVGPNGAGKTTTTVLLAQSLAHRDVKVAVVDLDPSGDTTHWLAAHPHPNIIVRPDADSPLPDGCSLQIIDSEGKSRFEQVLTALPDIGLFVVPCSASPLEITGATTAVAAIKELRRRKSQTRILWNRLNLRASNAQKENLDAQSRAIGAEAFKVQIPRSEAFADAANAHWLAVRIEHRQLWENVGIELLTLLLR